MALVNAVEVERWTRFTSAGDTVERASDKEVVLLEALAISKSGNWAIIYDQDSDDYFQVVHVPSKKVNRSDPLVWSEACALVKELGD